MNKEVSWEEHSQWFSNLIAHPKRHMYIIEVEGNPAGQVRFIGSEHSDMAEISIYLLKPFIGQGRGGRALEQACGDIGAKINIKIVIAYILEGNVQSQNAFETAGFVSIEKCDMNGHIVESKSGHKTYCLKVPNENPAQ